MPPGGGLNCFPATSWLGGAIATWAAPQPASASIIPPKSACRIETPRSSSAECATDNDVDIGLGHAGGMPSLSTWKALEVINQSPSM